MRIVLLTPFVLAGCTGKSDINITGSWEVTVTGETQSCFNGDAGYLETYRYDLSLDTSSVEIYLDDELFASGVVSSGCELEYQTPIWYEERGANYLKWQIEGSAVYENAAGGCGLDEGVDWVGQETIFVVENTDPSINQDCTYSMRTEGVYLGNG